MSTVRDELAQWVAAARGAIAWHLEGGEFELPVPDDYRPPPLGRIELEGPPPPPVEAKPAPKPQRTPRPEPAAAPPPPSAPVARFTPPPEPAPEPSPAPVVAPAAPARPELPVDGADEAAALALHRLAREARDCTRCGLCERRTEVVFGAGDPVARVLFVADAPGVVDDQLALPFTGEDGGLLGKMIRAMGLSRGQVYLTTLVKCRPGTAVVPSEALGSCRSWFDQQLDAIQPEVIVALGEGAARVLADSRDTLPVLRGRAVTYREIPVQVTFHPLAVLQSRADRDAMRRAVWKDLKTVMRRLGLSPPR